MALHRAAHGVRFDELPVLSGGIETDVLVAAGVPQEVRSFCLGIKGRSDSVPG